MNLRTKKKELEPGALYREYLTSKIETSLKLADFLQMGQKEKDDIKNHMTQFFKLAVYMESLFFRLQEIIPDLTFEQLDANYVLINKAAEKASQIETDAIEKAYNIQVEDLKIKRLYDILTKQIVAQNRLLSLPWNNEYSDHVISVITKANKIKG